MDFDVLDYNANDGRKERISRYKKLLNLDENFEITEDNIDDYGVDWISVFYNCPRDRVKAELLGQKWSDFERE